MRKVFALLVTGVVLVSSLLVAPAAMAAPTASDPPTVSTDVQLRWCTWGSSGRCDPRPDAVVPAGATVNAVCWTKGLDATGAYKTDHWIFVAYGLVKGWVHSSWVKNSGLHVRVKSGPGELSSCDATRIDIAATNFALRGVVNRAYMNKTAALALFPAEEWGYDGTRSLVGQLSGNSPKIPHAGYKAVGKTIPGSGKAIDIFTANYASRATTAGAPPIGALVFWGPAQDNGNRGLEGISVGGGKVFVAQGRRTNDGRSPRFATIVDISSVAAGTYLGWVTP
ncbi:hypothetical protein [Microbacterium sp. RURRCA19A]|uniref:hypothetical protein n=1 Tax=Microbacterium sp. RURRCA19A TaxID=1907391 RepID=UPI000954C9E8|nr:hypothetical protein [Microbacterium sp. RURRCA19A]SIS09900.1 hypothetical protein SAMN05880568_2735 [Microbacterium sp. RURRCA19A]